MINLDYKEEYALVGKRIDSLEVELKECEEKSEKLNPVGFIEAQIRILKDYQDIRTTS